MGVFLMSVCHLVIFVDDSLGSIELWKYMQAIEMLKWNIPDVSTPKVPPSISVSVQNNFLPVSNEFFAEPGD